MSGWRASVRALAGSLLAGPWEQAALRVRAEEALGGGPPPPGPFADRLIAELGGRRAPHPARLERAIAADRGFRRAWGRRRQRPLQIRHLLSSPEMEPPLAGIDCPPLPAVPTTGELADWLGLTSGQLDWMADCQNRNDWLAVGPRGHYHYHWRAREGGPPRLVECPKERLKSVQRRILREILDLVPQHSAAHGFRVGCSCVSYAAPHSFSPVVVRMDFKTFFQSIHRRRVLAIFRSLGYPYTVARSLTGLCTHAVAADALRVIRRELGWSMYRRLATPHLPQGAPTSPALANLCAYRFDCRLTGLATSRGLTYTRYADDLAFSGDAGLARGFTGFHVLVARIALEEGFELNTRKTRIMHDSGRQRLAGIVVNRGVNVARDEYDRLKAILNNCVRLGAAGQNRDNHPDFRAHIVGRVAHVARLNPSRGERLRALLERIDWDEA